MHAVSFLSIKHRLEAIKGTRVWYLIFKLLTRYVLSFYAVLLNQLGGFYRVMSMRTSTVWLASSPHKAIGRKLSHTKMLGDSLTSTQPNHNCDDQLLNNHDGKS